MRIHHHCPTEKAVFLVGIPDRNGLLHFPSVHSWLPGLHFTPAKGVRINDQLRDTLALELGEPPGPDLVIFQEFRGDIPEKGYTLYVGLLPNKRHLMLDHWRPLPDLLRRMPADRNRLVCLKAWQILSGVHKEKLHAVEHSGPL